MKNCNKKLKPQFCAKSPKGEDCRGAVYPSFRNIWYKTFSTFQEKRKSCGHEIEYRCYGIYVRPKRLNKLLSTRDEVLSHYKVSSNYSWKFASKRKKQYWRSESK